MLTETHIQFPPTTASSIQFASRPSTDVQQLFFMAQIHTHLTLLFKLPATEYEERVRRAFHLLDHIVRAPERLGAMTEDYLRRLFSMGEQILRFLEGAISERFGGRKVDLLVLEGQRGYEGKCNTTHKEKKHLRRGIVMASVAGACNLPVHDARRVSEAKDAIVTAGGVAIEFKVQNGGVWKMPTTECKDERWQAEMFWYSMKALVAVAQTLGYRYLRWPVYIRDTRVPGTGVKIGKVLEDWQFKFADE